ncbi:MAG: GNAT family N-acetyltransferase [Candidatus Omnitrophica bacterium]|nr:GNAT family N-acetyltransferase [Candidatus Omnitrophota bacterium]
MPRKVKKVIVFSLCFLLLFEQSGFAQIAGQLDVSGYINQLRSSLTQDKFRPLHLRYLSYDSLQNNFKLLLDKGDQHKKGQSPAGTVPMKELQDSTRTLLKYFFVGVTLPNNSFWVNLRPDSPKQVIDDSLAETDVGKILLGADLQLKKDTARFTSPQTQEGRAYWDKLYKKAGELFGSDNVTIPTLTRPWIVPDEIIIRETDANAYIYKATLKVQLEQDYLRDSPLRGQSLYVFDDERLKQLNEYSSQLIRELIIPKLTKEVNTAERYAPLRQVYYSLILAQWFKARFSGKSGVYSWLIDRKNLTGLTSQKPWSTSTYFKAYQKSFKDGEYNIKEQVSAAFSAAGGSAYGGGQAIRSYFSGGASLAVPIPLPGQTSAGVTSIVGSPQRELPQGPKYIAGLANGGTMDNPVPQKIELTVNQEAVTAIPSSEKQSDLITRAEKVLGRSLYPEEAAAVQRAHAIGQGHYLGEQNPDGTYAKNENPDLAYTPEEIREKARILRQAGFSIAELDKLMRYGVAGNSQRAFLNVPDFKTLFSPTIKEQVTLINPYKEIPGLQEKIISVDFKKIFEGLPSINQFVPSAERSEGLLNNLVDDFIKLAGVTPAPEQEVELKTRLRELLKNGFFAGLQDISSFERQLNAYASRAKDLFSTFGLTVLHEKQIVPALVRMAVWAKNLGLIDIGNISRIPNAPRTLTVGIATRALAGLGDITKIAMIVNGLFEEFEQKKVGLRIKVFVFAEDAAKMQAIEKGLREKLKGYKQKKSKHSQNDLEIIPVQGVDARLEVGDPSLDDVNVFITLVRPVSETLRLPKEVSPAARIPRICFTLGEYDSMVPPNPRMRSMSLFEVKTGFADDTLGFFVNPYTEQLYEQVRVAGPNALTTMRSKLLEDILIEIWLQSRRTEFLAEAADAAYNPTEEELAREMVLETERCRVALPAFQGAIQQVSASRWGVVYMHHQAIRYLQALQQFRQEHRSKDSVTVFTFFGEKNRESASLDEWEELRQKAWQAGLPFEFYDLSRNPSAIAAINFTKPAVRVINLGMRSLEGNIRSMALSDMPLGATGDESLLTALTLRKPVLYEVMSWKRNLFEALLRQLANAGDAGSAVENALRSFDAGTVSSDVTAIFDSNSSASGVFSRLGDLITQRKLYSGLLLQMFNHIALEDFFAQMLVKYPLEVTEENLENASRLNVFDGYLRMLNRSLTSNIFLEGFKQQLNFSIDPDFYAKIDLGPIEKFKNAKIEAFKFEEIKIEMFDFTKILLDQIANSNLALWQRLKVWVARLLLKLGFKNAANRLLFSILAGTKIKVEQIATQASIDEDATARRKKAEEVLGRNFSDDEFAAIQRAHAIGQGHYLGEQNPDGTYAKNENPDLAYTPQEIREKARILRAAGFNIAELDRLIRYGIAGSVESQNERRADVNRRAAVDEIIGNIKGHDQITERTRSVAAKIESNQALNEDYRGALRDIYKSLVDRNSLVALSLKVEAGDVIVTFNQQNIKFLNTQLGTPSTNEIIRTRQMLLIKLLIKEGLIGSEEEGKLLLSYKQDKFVIRRATVQKFTKDALRQKLDKVAGELSKTITADIGLKDFVFQSYYGVSEAISGSNDQARILADMQALQGAKIARRNAEEGQEMVYGAGFEQTEFDNLMRVAQQIRGELKLKAGEMPSQEEMNIVRGKSEKELKGRELLVKKYLDIIDLFDYPKSWSADLAIAGQEKEGILRILEGLEHTIQSRAPPGSARERAAQIRNALVILDSNPKNPTFTSGNAFHYYAFKKSQENFANDPGRIIAADVRGFWGAIQQNLALAQQRYLENIDKDIATRRQVIVQESLNADDKVKQNIQGKVNSFAGALEEHLGKGSLRVNISNGDSKLLVNQEGGDEIVFFVPRGFDLSVLAGELDKLGINVRVMAAEINPRIERGKDASETAFALGYTEVTHASYGEAYVSAQEADAKAKDLEKKGLNNAIISEEFVKEQEPAAWFVYYQGDEGPARESYEKVRQIKEKTGDFTFISMSRENILRFKDDIMNIEKNSFKVQCPFERFLGETGGEEDALRVEEEFSELILENDKLVGYIIGHRESKRGWIITRDDGSGFVYEANNALRFRRIAFAGEFRGRGLGTQALNRLAKKALDAGIEKIFLRTRFDENIEAEKQAFLARAGFRQVGKTTVKGYVSTVIEGEAQTIFNNTKGDKRVALDASLSEDSNGASEETGSPQPGFGGSSGGISAEHREEVIRRFAQEHHELVNDLGRFVAELDRAHSGILEVFRTEAEQRAEIGRVLGLMQGQGEGKTHEVSAPVADKAPGGIDFRSLPIQTQPPDPLRDNPLRGQSPAGTIPVLEDEWQKIQNMLQAGIIPSGQRIKEYLENCCSKDNFKQEIDKVLGCIADILRLEEERILSTEPGLREFLLILESDKPANELKIALNNLNFSAKEPILIEP